MAHVQSVRTLSDWQALAAAPDPVLLFKHSTTCPISAAAHQHFHAFAGGLPAGRVRLAEVRVIEERPISLQIAADTHVMHQSPQAILLQQGRVLWHASHHEINMQTLRYALAANGAL